MSTAVAEAPRVRQAPGAARLLVLWAAAVAVWWGFAFWPTPAGDTSWIAAAQGACFGSVPGGLPATEGWMMLTLAPLLMLACLVTAFHGDLADSLPALLRRPAWRAALVVLAVVFAVEGAWAALRVADARRFAVAYSPRIGEPMPAEYPRADIPVAPFRLVDQDGQPFASAMLTGRPAVLSFVFAHCTSVCPALARTLRNATDTLGPGRTQLALITLDPWRDTPAALPEVARRWSLPAGTHLLSGPPDDVCRALDDLDVARERDLRSGDVSHVPLVLVIDRRGRIAYRFVNPPASWIVEAVRRVEADS